MENKEQQIIYFTEKLNKLRIKELTFNSNGYQTPQYLIKDMRLTEIALSNLNKETK
jgi:hypothetical protein